MVNSVNVSSKLYIGIALILASSYHYQSYVNMGWPLIPMLIKINQNTWFVYENKAPVPIDADLVILFIVLLTYNFKRSKVTCQSQ